MDADLSDPLALTPAAARFLLRMLRFSGLGPGAGVQLRVTPGGCSGYSVQFDLAAAAAATEQTLTVGDGIHLYVDAATAQLLPGATLDFAETAASAGLSLRTPAAPASSCSTAAPPPLATFDVASLRRRVPA